MARKRNVVVAITAGAGAAAILMGIAATLGRAAEPSLGSAAPVGHLLFTTSLHCIACHSNVKAPDGEDISIGWNWRATMMANAARDPYWHAGIRRESLDHPALVKVIEDTCSTCHMPMQRFQAHAEGGQGEVFRYLNSIRSGAANVEPGAILEEAADPSATISADGVSCTVCHQIRPDNFGEESSYDGGFLVDLAKKPEEREIFGPYDVDDGRTRAMHSSAGFVPHKADHIQRAELCAGCHTLITHAFDDKGNPAGSLPEQVPYQEWLASDFVKTDTCQACHMPLVKGEAPLSSTLPKTHDDVRRHTFVGANAFMLRILKDHRGELGVIAPPEELEAAASRTEQYLASEAGSVEIKNARVSSGRLEFAVTATNKAGHKLPTAYPSRRVWLHVTVRDGRGATVFESGAPRADGSIVGNDNDADAAKFETHYTRITSPDEVQIYEAVMGDFAGKVTTGLLYGTHYLKDNRILPRGFDKASADKLVAVAGNAESDADFTGGFDTTTYDIALSNAVGPFAITVELDYQSIGYRWAQNLRNFDAEEPKRFVGYYEQSANQSVKLLARASAQAR